MPPKKKGGKAKKKGATGTTGKCERQQMLTEIGSLKEHLELRCEITRRAKATANEMRCKVQLANDDVINEQQNKSAIVSELKRRYHTETADLSLQIDLLSQQAAHLQMRLADSQETLCTERRTNQRQIKDKNDQITELKMKVNHLEAAFENIIDVSFDTMQEHLHNAQANWNIEALSIEKQHKSLLTQSPNQSL